MQTRVHEEAAQPAAGIAGESAVSAGSKAQVDEEQRQIRRLQIMMNMVMQVIAQDGSLSVEDASQMVADARAAARRCFRARSWPTISSGSRASSG